jgi:hypothetical protein
MDFASDGLYFTDIYGEQGFIGLGDTDSNIYRVSPGTPPVCQECGSHEFRAGISIIPWYPKNTTEGIEYIFECKGIEGSNNYRYDWNFGNGQSATNIIYDRQRQVYPYHDQEYNVSCRVRDQVTGKNASASMIINPIDFIPPGTGE